MHKIRNKNFAVSPGKFGSNKVELLDVSDFKHTGSHFTGYIPEEDSLRQVFDEDISFFYTIETFDSTNTDSRKLTSLERGLGRVKRTKDKFFLVREVPLETRTQDDTIRRDKANFFSYPEGTYLVIGSYIPTNYVDLFYREHSIICSTDKLTPSPIQLEENSVIGRIDGEIKSLDSDDISFILSSDYVIRSLHSNNDPILISSDHVELTNEKSKLFIAHAVLKPRRGKPRNREQGSLIFNSTSNRLEYYDGTKWRKVAIED